MIVERRIAVARIVVMRIGSPKLGDDGPKAFHSTHNEQMDPFIVRIHALSALHDFHRLRKQRREEMAWREPELLDEAGIV
jgi:hypothetical protein